MRHQNISSLILYWEISRVNIAENTVIYLNLHGVNFEPGDVFLIYVAIAVEMIKMLSKNTSQFTKLNAFTSSTNRTALFSSKMVCIA